MTKKRSTRCRIVFRCELPDTKEVLMVVSGPILCTQPAGCPEVSHGYHEYSALKHFIRQIAKKSLSESDVTGGNELFIIGKNFVKESKVVWKSCNWMKIVDPNKEFLHSVCKTNQNESVTNRIDFSIRHTSYAQYLHMMVLNSREMFKHQFLSKTRTVKNRNVMRFFTNVNRWSVRWIATLTSIESRASCPWKMLALDDEIRRLSNQWHWMMKLRSCMTDWEIELNECLCSSVFASDCVCEWVHIMVLTSIRCDWIWNLNEWHATGSSAFTEKIRIR